MTAYLDSSVLLRVVLAEPGRLTEWDSIATAATSVLTRAESLRTIDRYRLRNRTPERQVAAQREALYSILGRMNLIGLDEAVLDRASLPLPTEVGTLDAIHLVSAMLWRETSEGAIAFATHDITLGEAARATGFRVIGL